MRIWSRWGCRVWLPVLWLGLGATTLVVTAGPATAQMTFGAPTILPAPYSRPQGPILRDLDGDGDLDLVHVYGWPGMPSLAIRLNNGSGQFGDPLANPVPTTAASRVSGADFDQDGDVDLVYTIYSNLGSPGVYLARNNGNATFALESVPMTTSINPIWVEVADMDNDGYQDLAVHGYERNVIVFFNDHTGHFPTATQRVLGGFYGPLGLALGDFNGDGKKDVAVSCRNDMKVSVFLTDGTGAISTTPTDYPIGPNNYANGVVAIDVEGDGDLDLVTAAEQRGYCVGLRNNGAGGFQTFDLFALSGPNGGMVFQTADFDLDGKLDLLLTDSNGKITIFRNAGGGSFVNAFVFVESGVYPGPTAGDVDRDGLLDVVMTNDIWPAIQNPPTVVPAVRTFLNQSVNPNQPVAVAVPDTTAGYQAVLAIPVRVGQTTGKNVVSAEVFVAYDGDLLTPEVPAVTAAPLTAAWTIEYHVVPGNGPALDTLKIALADEGALTGSGNLVMLHFQVADVRHPATSPLTLAHVLLNAGTPAHASTAGSVKLVGVDGTVASQPDTVIPRWPIRVVVADADEDRDGLIPDDFTVGVTSGSQTERVTVTESGAHTGIFTGSIGTVFSLSFTSDDGRVQAKAGDEVVFTYVDSLAGAGVTVVRRDTTRVRGGHDSHLRTTGVAQPGDTVRVRVVDADLAGGVGVRVANGRTGEVETVLLSQFAAGDSVFYGRLFTASQAGAVGDSTLVVAKGDTLVVSYQDTLTALGGRAVRVDDTEGVEPFGDAEGNGRVQAYDAARVLYHRLLTYGGQAGSLSGVDSLSANVDRQAPWGILDGYDAALILQKVVGLIGRFEVQEPAAANHPQPETNLRPKALLEEREVALQAGEGYLRVWVDDREGIVSGELALEGIAGAVSMGAELEDFLVASQAGPAGLQVVFAGAQGVAGPGELLRIYSGVGPEWGRLTRASFNGGRLGVRVGEGEGAVRPRAVALYGNVPNPFNPATAIGYALPVAGEVELAVYDVVGQRVRVLVDQGQAPGTYAVTWDGRDGSGQPVAGGLYFYRLEAGGHVQVRKMLLLK